MLARNYLASFPGRGRCREQPALPGKVSSRSLPASGDGANRLHQPREGGQGAAGDLPDPLGTWLGLLRTRTPAAQRPTNGPAISSHCSRIMPRFAPRFTCHPRSWLSDSGRTGAVVSQRVSMAKSRSTGNNQWSRQRNVGRAPELSGQHADLRQAIHACPYSSARDHTLHIPMPWTNFRPAKISVRLSRRTALP